MLKNKKTIIALLILISVIGIGFVTFKMIQKNDTVEALSKYGSRGDEVKQIQTKLKLLPRL